ncbi:MAG: FtsX-like permease family protein, partial [Terriglobales bacterium]
LEPLYHPDIFVPLAAMAGPLGSRARRHPPQLGDTSEWWVQTIGRLRPHTALPAVKAVLKVDFARTVAAMPRDASFAGEKPALLAASAANGISANLQALAPMVEILGWLAALVLLIAVVNLANLLLARRAARRPELGLRMAIGAGPGTIARQVATESLLLAVLGGVAAVPAAALAQRALQTLVPAPVRLGLGFDGRVLGFTFLVALASGIVLALIHIWRIPASLQPALNEAAPGTTGPRIGKVLLGAQVAICLVVLAGAGLFLRTLRNLESVRTGIDSQHILLFGVAPGSDGSTGAQRGAFYAALLARLRSLPGVTSASAVLDPPGANGRDFTGAISITPERPRDNPRTALETISPGFFATYRLPLLAGRDFSAADDATAPAVAIVNQEMSKRFNGDPIGQKLYWGVRALTVVGVAANAAYDGVEGGAVPIVYSPLAQRLALTPAIGIAVRSRLPEAALARPIRAAVARLAPGVPVTSLETQQQAMAATYVPQRVLALACTGLGLVVLLLAAVGLYGLMAYALARRTREIGVRLALGASPRNMARMLAGELLWVVGAGAAAGMALILAAGKLLASLLFRLSPRDPLTLVGAAAFLFLVAAAAAALPARRAARLDPAITLRQE